MKKYFDNVKVDWEELERQRREMEELIALGKKNKKACLDMLDEHNAYLDKKVAEKERQSGFCIHSFF